MNGRLAEKLLGDLRIELAYVRNMKKSYQKRIDKLDERESDILAGFEQLRADLTDIEEDA